MLTMMIEDSDRLSESQLLKRVQEICSQNGIPVSGWEMWYHNSPGPKCLRRYEKDHLHPLGRRRTHTAYVHSFHIVIWQEGPFLPLVTDSVIDNRRGVPV